MLGSQTLLFLEMKIIEVYFTKTVCVEFQITIKEANFEHFEIQLSAVLCTNCYVQQSSWDMESDLVFYGELCV